MSEVRSGRYWSSEARDGRAGESVATRSFRLQGRENTGRGLNKTYRAMSSQEPCSEGDTSELVELGDPLL